MGLRVRCCRCCYKRAWHIATRPSPPVGARVVRVPSTSRELTCRKISGAPVVACFFPPWLSDEGTHEERPNGPCCVLSVTPTACVGPYSSTCVGAPPFAQQKTSQSFVGRAEISAFDKLLAEPTTIVVHCRAALSGARREGRGWEQTVSEGTGHLPCAGRRPCYRSRGDTKALTSCDIDGRSCRVNALGQVATEIWNGCFLVRSRSVSRAGSCTAHRGLGSRHVRR